VARGDEVTVLDDLRGASISNLDAVIDRIRFEEADLIETDLAPHVRGVDVVFHLAANAYVPPSVENPRYDFDLNLGVTVRLLDAIRSASQRPSLVFASSAAVYGNPQTIPMPENHPFVPLSPYGVHKLAAEQEVRVFAELYGIRAAALRLFASYGPRQRKQVVFDLVRKVDANPNEIEVHGDGTQVRDFVFVSDVVQALLLVASDAAPRRGEAYNVGTGRGVTILDLVGEICRSMGHSPRVRWTGSVRPGDAQAFVADISKLESIGYRPRVSIGEGVGRIVAWVRSRAAELR
jgi:UDP-glucose 4-epimerase